MSGLRFFRDDIFAAHELFNQSCHDAQLAVDSHVHPATGPGGESLATDCVLIGREDASRLLILVSGTHGVEALCGSACQTGFVAGRAWQDFDDDTAVLLIHALNCWGAAHLRRNNEDNVDLNRNFLDFAEPGPVNEAYEELHDALSCPQYRGPERDAADGVLANYLTAHGVDRYIAALMGGQYRHADGMSFGGSEPTWSRRLLSRILAPFERCAGDVYVVEYHSGLGPYGYGMAVTMQTGDELERVRSAYGRWVVAPNEPAGEETSHPAPGHTTQGYKAGLPNACLSAIVLEFGTYPPMISLPVLRDDHWLTHFGDVSSKEGRKIKQQLLEMHYPADPDWRQAVWDRSTQVIDQTRRAMERHGR